MQNKATAFFDLSYNLPVARAKKPVHNRFNIFFIILNAPFILGKKIDAQYWTSYIEKGYFLQVPLKSNI